MSSAYLPTTIPQLDLSDCLLTSDSLNTLIQVGTGNRNNWETKYWEGEKKFDDKNIIWFSIQMVYFWNVETYEAM